MLLYFCSTILATFVVAVLFCHYRYVHEKRLGFGTVTASAMIANAAVLFSWGFYEEGWHIFTIDAWVGGKGGLAALLFIFGGITIICILPALGVAVYYERKSKRDRNPWPNRTGANAG
jgi:hypothetical protein